MYKPPKEPGTGDFPGMKPHMPTNERELEAVCKTFEMFALNGQKIFDAMAANIDRHPLTVCLTCPMSKTFEGLTESELIGAAKTLCYLCAANELSGDRNQADTCALMAAHAYGLYRKIIQDKELFPDVIGVNEDGQ